MSLYIKFERKWGKKSDQLGTRVRTLSLSLSLIPVETIEEGGRERRRQDERDHSIRVFQPHAYEILCVTYSSTTTVTRVYMCHIHAKVGRI